MSATEPARLHEAQIDVPSDLVARLIAEQAPQWAHLPLTRVPSNGTIHRVDLLGDDMVVRVPFIDWGKDEAGADEARLPLLAEALEPVGVRVPALLFRGRPTAEMPWDWGVYERLPGRHPDPESRVDQGALVEGLAAVIGALRSRSALRDLGTPSPAMFDFAADDELTRPLVVALGSTRALAAWDAGVAASAHNPEPALTWIHGDLMPGNLFLDRGSAPQLTGVIDWGAAGMGDPALDLLPAWACLEGAARRDFLDAVGATEVQIAKARAYAVSKAAWGIPYYEHTLPGFAATVRFALTQVEADDP